MKNDVLQDAARYTKAHQRKKRWYKVITCLACAVVFCTVYALILPAVTLEKGACEIPEHTHGDSCYTQVTVTRKEPVCSIESLNLHQHEDSCYNSEDNLTCGYADFVVHTHDSSCYDEDGKLWCPLPEIEAHTHDKNCYAEAETDEETVHTHTDGCYTVQRGELSCTEETNEGHTHTEECFDENEELVCQTEESSGHQHTDECYAQEKVLTCELSTEQDKESSKPKLICDKEEIILHEHTSDCFDEDGKLICGKIQVLEHQHTDACFKTVEEPEDADTLTCTNTDENHTHGPLCYGTWELTCGMEEHVHSEECQSTEEAPEQGNLNMILPEGAQIPEGYDANYSYIDPDNRFGVMVYASEDALPDNAVLSAELLEQGSEAYEAAQQALTDTVYDGFTALDIHFTVDGEEIEPESSVYVCINVMGLLPEDADADSLAVQHHEQSDTAPLTPGEEETPAPAGAVTVETVADATEETGQVEALDNGTETTADVAAAFEVEDFSTFTVTWQDSYKLILHYVDSAGKSIYEGESETALATYSELESVTLSQYANRINHSGYAYDSAYVLLNGGKTTAVQVRYNKKTNSWEYAVNKDDWTTWMDGTNHTAEAYLCYTAVDENTFVPPENNIYPIDAFNTYNGSTNVILLNPRLKSPDNQEITYTNIVNIGKFFGSEFNYDDWNAYRIECRNGRYQVIQAGAASPNTGVQNNEAYLLLVKKTYAEQVDLYVPKADWPKPETETQLDGVGDTVTINWLSGADVNQEQISNETPLAYFTFSPKNNNANAGARDDDVAAVADSAIDFQLFDYSTKINRPNGAGDSSWRPITPYFQFRGQQESNNGLQNGDRDNRYDEDGFTVNHATVERVLENNYPVLDPNRNALGGAKSPAVTDGALPQSERSLAYLFSSGDGAVTAYNPINTILQKSGTHYYYNSANNAVDYDISSSMFRVRNYVERNGSTANYGSAQKYYDFLPFNYTDGQVVGTYLDDARAYNLESADVNYWFGMRMDVDFYQSKDGKLNGEEMKFHFSGDDDVWVFVDDVLVLDLGGTHGTVTGSINFATGEIQQYLDWDGVVGTEGKTSFPTTIKDCYQAAGKDPNGGWNGDIFADYTKHKLSFFYMERGCAVANCSIDFNLPTLPEKSLQVAKTLTADKDADADVVKHLEDTMEYKFRVVKANADGNPTDQLLINEGDSYTLSGAGLTANETREVGGGGYFTLKAGQMAEFTNMLARFNENDSVKRYVVQEVLPTGLTGQYQEVVYTIGSDTGQCTSDTTTVATDFTGYNSPAQNADTGNLVNYTNKVDTEQLSTLAITKTQVGSSLNDPQFYYMKVQLGPDADQLVPISVGTTYYVGDTGTTRSVEQAGIIKIAAGETAKVKLLAGTYYKVEEVADGNGTPLTGSEGYTPAYSGQTSGTVADVGAMVEITVTNTFLTGNLELTKFVNNTADGSTDGEFAFELKFQVGDNWTATDYTAAYTTTNSGQTHTGNTLSFTKQDGYAATTVKLYHGEKVTITGLPVGAQVSIAETNADGYSVGWKVNQEEFYGKTVTAAIKANETAAVICTNTTGYELPDTGGSGTITYISGGFLLMAGALFLLLYQYMKRRKEDMASF